jgi:hypothetical protein
LGEGRTRSIRAHIVAKSLKVGSKRTETQGIRTDLRSSITEPGSATFAADESESPAMISLDICDANA